MRTFPLLAAVLTLAASPLAWSAGDVAIDGTVVPKASATIDVTQDIIEFQSGGEVGARVAAGRKHYAVCVQSGTPIAVLDAELPALDTPSRFTVTIEDGRSFARCLVASVKSDGPGGKRRLTYCLRCEDVSTPTN